MSRVNYNHLHGQRVKLTRGYNAGKTGTVVSTEYVSDVTRADWIAYVQADEGPVTGLGTWEGNYVTDVSYLEML